MCWCSSQHTDDFSCCLLSDPELIALKTLGDGNCLFNAVSYFLAGDWAYNFSLVT